jgi:transposase
MLKMDEINKIRKAHTLEGESVYALAKQYKRSWETVNRMVTQPRDRLEQKSTRPNRKSSLLTPELKATIEKVLDREVELRVHRKQRYTASRLCKELKTQGLYTGSLRRFHELMREIRFARDEVKVSSCLPLSFALGSVLQVDHGEVDCIMACGRGRCYLFVAAVPGYPLRYCQVFPVKSSEAWGEFHERAFTFFGGIFARLIVDNDTVLVNEILGNERRQTNFSLSLQEHYGFTINFCQPAAGNEKGSVENAVGYCRRNYLVGCPEIVDWDNANKTLEDHCRADCDAEIMTSLRANLSSLLPHREWRKWLCVRVSSYQLITVENRRYSVPERYVGSWVRVGLGIFDLEVFDHDNCIAKHRREFSERDSLVLDHYLDQLERKPGALWDCKAVQQEPFDDDVLSLRRRLEERYGNREANQQFIQVLLMRRRVGTPAWNEAIRTALSSNAIEAQAIEVDLQQEKTATNIEETLQDRFGHLTQFEMAPDLSSYEALCPQEVLHVLA